MNAHVYLDILRKSIEEHASKPCLHIKRNDNYVSWSYAEFGRDLNRLAGALQQCGFAKGSNAIVIGQNTPEWVIAYHGIMLAGGCVVPIDPNLPAAEIHEIVRLTRASVVFCSGVYVNLFREIADKLTLAGTLVTLDNSSASMGFDTFLASAKPETDITGTAVFDPDSPCAIVFTSGTTGKAKGAVLVQKTFAAVITHGIPRMHVDSRDTMLAVLPLHHVFGCAACCAAALGAGLDVVFVPVLKGPLIVEAVRDKQVSVMPAVPQMMELFYENIMRTVKARGAIVRMVFSILRALSAVLGPLFGMPFRKMLFKGVHAGFGGKLNLFISGGSSLKKRYFNGFRLMGFSIVEGYGLTETYGPITICPPADARLASVGPVLPENEARIDNPDASGIGEICFRGNTVFAGYFNNAAATAQVFDQSGWFHTGDMGRISRNGFIYITGRCKDIIVLDNGKNVYPDELEDYYSASTLIEEIGVVGVIENGSEIVAAVIVPSKEVRRRYSIEKATQIVYDELIRIGKLLPTYKKIGNFVVSYSPLPRTTTRKIKKNDLKLVFAAAKKSKHAKEVPGGNLSFLEMALMETEEWRAIAGFIEELAGEAVTEALGPRSHLELDLKIDSLKKLDLIGLTEKQFGIVMPQEDLLKIETIGDLVNTTQELIAKRETLTSGSVADVRKRISQDSSYLFTPTENNSFLYRNGSFIVSLVSKTFWNAGVRGAENAAVRPPVIFAANHQSVVDVAWVLSALPWEVRRDTYTLGKKELTASPLMSELLRQFNLVAVEREGDVLEALRTSLAILRSAKNLLLFPEGTRSITGEIGPFKNGIGTLMIESGAPVVPVRIVGADKIWPSGGGPRILASRHHRPQVIFGRAIGLNELMPVRNAGASASAAEVSEAVRKEILSL